MPDWIDTFLEETSAVRSPPAFKLWTAISILAAVLERRVYTHTDAGLLYPNMYTILTGPPSAGKGLMINTARSMWEKVSGLFIGPDDVSKASFLDALNGSIRVDPVNGTSINVFSAMTLPCREFGVLFPTYDPAFMQMLTDIWDCNDSYNAPRRTTISLNIQKPTVNILAGVTPDYLGELLPEVAWGQGFTARLMFVYGIKPSSERNVFAKRRDINTTGLSKRLVEIFHDLQGEIEWEEDARQAMNTWVNAGMEPKPTYGRLLHYIERREVHILKMSMISAISAERNLTVTLADFIRAKRWIEETEGRMPDIFRAMAQKSDAQLIRDLHYHLYTLWAATAIKDRKPLHEREIYDWLSSRATSERIPRIIEVAERSGAIRRGTYPDEWIPRPLSDLKVDD